MFIVVVVVFFLCCKVGRFNVGLSEDGLTFGGSLKWPFEELQLLALNCQLRFAASCLVVLLLV